MVESPVMEMFASCEIIKLPPHCNFAGASLAYSKQAVSPGVHPMVISMDWLTTAEELLLLEICVYKSRVFLVTVSLTFFW